MQRELLAVLVEVLRVFFNAYLKRPNPHDWSGEKQEINGCMCLMNLPDVHLIAHKTIVVQSICLYACADLELA